jgi:hypothetical protein
VGPPWSHGCPRPRALRRGGGSGRIAGCETDAALAIGDCFASLVDASGPNRDETCELRYRASRASSREIAAIIDRTEANSRQLVTRARKHVEASRPLFDADEAARDLLLERFLAAAEEGDLKALEELLAEDAVL